MEELLIHGRDDEHDIFKRFTSHYDAPAYMRREKRVQETNEQLMTRCTRQRDDMIGMVRTRLGMLAARAGDLDALRPLLTHEQIETLRSLVAELAPQLRVPVEPTTSLRALRGHLREMNESVDRFNRRWQEFLSSVDLRDANEAREGYNRYYLLEKECAVRSPAVARNGFRRLELLTHAELFVKFPLLPVLQEKG